MFFKNVFPKMGLCVILKHDPSKTGGQLEEQSSNFQDKKKCE